jgi:multisubunit Na+/H+ antiporter MnhB subunit
VRIVRLARWRSQIAAGGVAACGLLVALSATLNPSRWPIDASPGVRPIVRPPDAVVVVAVVSFGLATLLMLALLVPRGVRRRRKNDEEFELYYEQPQLSPWPVLLLLVLLLSTLGGVGYALWHGWVPIDAGIPRGSGGRVADAPPPLPPPPAPGGAEKPPAPMPVFNSAVVVLALVAGLASLALMLWVYVGDRFARWWAGPWLDAKPRVTEAVTDSLEDLRAVADARVAIIKCYRRFEHALAAAHAGRAPWQTPGEFMRAALRRLALPAGAVEQLTGLFEVARFSQRPLGSRERDAAWEALSEIKVALERRESDVAAP